MITLFNPTNENLTGWHIGIEYNIGPEERIKVEDATGRHLINHLGSRGLETLEYGDNEEDKRIEGIRRNSDFKKRNLRKFNEQNEQRKVTGLSYNPPTDELKEYSRELKIELVEPYTVKVENAGATKDLENDFRGLQKTVASLAETVSQLMAHITSTDDKGKKK